MPEDPHWRLQVIGADGTELEGLSNQRHAFNPSWSVQGILFADTGGIYIVEPGGETRALYEGSNQVRNPVLSPDGQAIVATMEFHDHWEVVRLNTDGTGLVRLTKNYESEHSVAPAWSPDGEHIAYLTGQDGAWALWVMDAEGGSQQPLAAEALAGLEIEYDFMAEHVLDWR